MVQGEGAAIFVFEELEHAKRRGANIICEVKGFAMSSDAADIVNPSKQGAARAISNALQDAQVNVEDVGYINAHGTGTAANDKTECSAVADVFGHHADKIMISSTKSMHGHIIGGTGAVELLACILALRDGIIAPLLATRSKIRNVHLILYLTKQGKQKLSCYFQCICVWRSQCSPCIAKSMRLTCSGKYFDFRCNVIFLLKIKYNLNSLRWLYKVIH